MTPMRRIPKNLRDAANQHLENDFYTQSPPLQISITGSDAAKAPQQPEPGTSVAQAAADWATEKIADNHARQPSFWSEIKAMAREAIKDVRQALVESYFGKPEHSPELGAPLNPTQHEAYRDRHESQQPDAYDPAAYMRPGATPEKDRGRGR